MSSEAEPFIAGLTVVTERLLPNTDKPLYVKMLAVFGASKLETK
jgi:hypothetical protein